MTVEQEVDALTTAVDNLKSTVVSKKATLDASVVDAQSATSQAQSAKTAALSARDQANASKNAALGYAASAASAVAYQDLTALAESKAVTATDVFIYDTSKDSDGGAWRHRTTSTSWYNEALNTATRGARREFPAVAVIVAEAGAVTIYDGDDPALPMWMVFSRPGTATADTYIRSVTVSSVSALNGIVSFGNANAADGLLVAGFIADTAFKVRDAASAGSLLAAYQEYTGGLVQRSLASPALVRTGKFQLVNPVVNDVAMTVLPNAPIDPATGLPVPTIAVATAGGVSVIRDDGTVVDSAATVAVKSIDIDSDILFFTRTAGASSSMPYFTPLPILSDGFAATTYVSTASFGGIPTLLGYPDKVAIGANQGHLYAGSIAGTSYSGGVSHLAHYPGNIYRSMIAYTTPTYNTGWMPGNIKGAFLSDTDDTDLVGSGELVTNGTFDTDLTGWTDNSINGGSVAYSSGTVELTSVAAGIGGQLHQDVTTVVGRRYRLTADRPSGNVIAQVPGSQSANDGGPVALEFVATSTTSRINFLRFNAGTGVIDNISVKLADADRSVNNKGLIVNGTITRAPVATGAELVAYSGFSASNYLEQPYNSALDFGTGDFCVMGWMNQTASAVGSIIDRFASSRAGAGFEFRTDITGRFVFFTADSGGSASYLFSSVSGFGYGVPVFFTAIRSNGSLSVYINGRLDTPSLAVNSGTVRNISNTLLSRVGLRSDSTLPFNGSLALLRISATAPTAEQIRKIYEDERPLFQENAACTLYGASDAVTALAHDPDTGLLHVGTSAGRSVFQGLRRVSNTTTAVGAAISASGGMVVEE